MSNFYCLICNNEKDNSFYTVREMQFGMRDEFDYCECSQCGCLQIVNPPENVSKYYPENYFSFQNQKKSPLKDLLNSYRDKHVLGNENLIGKLLTRIYGVPTYTKWLKKSQINFNDKILDVGCGTGKLLYRMGKAGFATAIGIDKFIDKDIIYKSGVQILKRSLFELNQKFDFIMMHHSLEHMSDQHKVFEKLSSILKTNKFLLIRIPVCSSMAWKRYKENWFALEAPRHFFLHTKDSINLIAEQHGFKIKDISYDSRSIQFWASIQYQNDIALMDNNSYFINPAKSMFTENEIDEFEKQTQKLNNNGGADQAVIYLQKVD